MALEAYRKKRDFRKTPEPKGAPARKTARGPLSFVIQKHAATRLHYDFRLELDGVLKSWAVPKGPSLDPKVQRLAVHVEDHPLEYGTFEGVIPKGEYGGGTVVLWDRGRWLPEGDPKSAYRKGKLDFELEGEKLHGRWHLVRSRQAFDEDGGKEQWLLIKGDDAFARRGSGDAVVKELPGSVATGRTLDEIAASKDRVWHSNTKGGGAKAAVVVDPKAAKGARRAPLPDRMEPELATLVSDAPVGEDWLHEIKFDGYRVLARVSDGEATFLTRRGQDWTEKFSSLARELEKLRVGEAVFDGEVVVLLPNGKTAFQALQDAIAKGRQEEMVYYLFDLLYLDGYDLRAVALEERKRMLEALLPFSAAGPVRASEHVVGNGEIFFAEACRLGLEGILSKRRDSRYRSGRGHDWVKTKCQLEQEFVIGGFTDPSGSRVGLGALLLGVYERGKLIYAGKVGTGFSHAQLETLRKRLAKLEQTTSPFQNPPRERGLHWVKPALVAEVGFTEWTKDGNVRHPTFRGLREDKAPTEVRREKPSTATEAKATAKARAKTTSTGRSTSTGGSRKTASSTSTRTSTSTKGRSGATARSSAGSGSAAASESIGGLERARAWAEGAPAPPRPAVKPKGPKETQVAGVRLSHPERVLFPEQGITKLEVARYYDLVGELMVPLIERRPLMLVRCPEGTASQCFFQKHANDQVPKSVSRVDIPEKDGSGEYMYVTDLEGVLTLLNLGSLELHTWGAHVDRIERPDRVIFDLDPDPSVGWAGVVRLALMMRDGLEALGLRSFAKTTGGKGLHVVVPIGRSRTWDEVIAFARWFAERMAEAEPGRYTLTMSKAKRKGRIFIDYLRNARGATAVEAYSTRARAGAPVSTPIGWEELGPRLSPNQWTVENFAQRLKKLKADPWEDYASVKQSLTAKIMKAVNGG